MTDKLEPTQADRIRFAEGWDEPMHKSAILDGEWDDNEHLQRFTAHRIEAERAALERAAKVAEQWPDRIEGGGIADVIRALAQEVK